MPGIFDPAIFDRAVFDTGSVTFTLDALVRVNQSGTVTLNAIVKKAGASSLTVDAIIRRVGSGSFTADAIVKRTQSGSFTIDGWIPGGTASQFTLDAWVRKQRSSSATADALVKRIVASSVSVDALVKKNRAASYTANGYVRLVRTGSITANAYIRAVHSFLVNGWVSAPSDTGGDEPHRNRHDRIDTHFGTTLASAIDLTGSYSVPATNLMELLRSLFDVANGLEMGLAVRFASIAMDALVTFTGPWDWESDGQFDSWITNDNSTDQPTGEIVWEVVVPAITMTAHSPTHTMRATGFRHGVSIWVISPVVQFMDGDVLSWWWRRQFDNSTYKGARVQVLWNSGGDSINVGSAVGDLGDFTDILYDSGVNYTTFPTAYTKQSVTFGLGSPVYARFAFRYYVPASDDPSNTSQSYAAMVGVDDIGLYHLATLSQSFAVDAYTAAAVSRWENWNFVTTPDDVGTDWTIFFTGTFTAVYVDGAHLHIERDSGPPTIFDQAFIYRVGPGPFSADGLTDFNMTMQFKIADWAGDGAFLEMGLGTNGNIGMFIERQMAADGGWNFWTYGSATDDHSTFTGDLDSSADYILRWEHAPLALGVSRLRVWKASDSEPSTWDASRSTTGDVAVDADELILWASELAFLSDWIDFT